MPNVTELWDSIAFVIISKPVIKKQKKKIRKKKKKKLSELDSARQVPAAIESGLDSGMENNLDFETPPQATQ